MWRGGLRNPWGWRVCTERYQRAQSLNLALSGGDVYRPRAVMRLRLYRCAQLVQRLDRPDLPRGGAEVHRAPAFRVLALNVGACFVQHAYHLQVTRLGRQVEGPLQRPDPCTIEGLHGAAVERARGRFYNY